jgi:transposase
MLDGVTEDAMSKPLVDDELWSIIHPMLPEHPPRPTGGILFVLKTGIAWEDFPCEMGCCGMTLLNRLRQWQRAGIWHRLHLIMLDRLRGAEQLDFSRVIVDAASVRAMHGGKKRERPRGPQEKRVETPPGHRRRRRAAGREADRRQPARRNPADAAGRCDPVAARQA